MDNMDKVFRIKEIMRYYNLNQKQFSSYTGIPEGNISKILRGERPCGEGIINKIILAFDNLSKKWLINGEGQMTITPTIQQTNVNGDNNYNNNGNMPICNYNHDCNCCSKAKKCPECGRTTGEVIVVEEVQKPIIPSEWAYKPDIDIFKEVMSNLDKVSMSRFIVLDSPVSAWMEIRDDSLVPRAYRGDRLGLLVYPKGQEDIIWGKFHAIDTISNGIIVRKLYPAEGGYRCVSPNEEYPELFVKFDNIQSVSRVVYVVRRAL